MIEILKGFLMGIGEGVVLAGLGYLKTVKEDFEPKKFFQTVIIGAGIGGGSALFGLTYEEAWEIAKDLSLITLFEYVKKIIWRRVKNFEWRYKGLVIS